MTTLQSVELVENLVFVAKIKVYSINKYGVSSPALQPLATLMATGKLSVNFIKPRN